MSKSNLRQPKSFNFGFPDSDDDEDGKESEKSQEGEEEAVVEEVHPPKVMGKKRAVPTLATNFEDTEETE